MRIHEVSSVIHVASGYACASRFCVHDWFKTASTADSVLCFDIVTSVLVYGTVVSSTSVTIFYFKGVTHFV